MDKQEFLRLLDKYLEGKTSDQEIEILENYYNSFQQNTQWNEAELGSSQELESHMLEQLKEAINNPQQVPIVPLYKRRWFRMAAAAVILFIIGASIWRPAQNRTEQPITSTDVNESLQKAIKSNHAVLMLANGVHINLDSVVNGVVAYQDKFEVRKQDSQLVYKQSVSESIDPSVAMTYHTVYIPKGKHYKVVLPDGSLVWLNAASVLRFPTSFKARERRVELSGEAYFEVAKNRSRPFQVYVSAHGINNQNGALVQVLGTHFNINAYNDEEVLKTTLLEGSIEVTPVHSSELKSHNSRILVPGQQAQIADHSSPSKEMTVQNVDVETAIAWKNNLFNFNMADIQTIMRQIARWYDVEVVYEGKVPVKNFSGKINRNTDLKTVLKILEQSGIHSHLEGKKIIVRS